MKKTIIICLAVTFIFSCKRYNLSKDLRPIHELFDNGGKWYIEKYEVDGLDSTEHAFPGNAADNEVGAMTFSPIKAKDYPSPIVVNQSFNALFEYKNILGVLKFANGKSICDRTIDKQCAESIFMKQCGGDGWHIDSLSKNTLVLSCNKDGCFNLKIKKSYRLILSKTKNESSNFSH